MQLCQGNKDITHFILNDLVAVMSHKQTVNQYTLSIINAMTEEGIQCVAFPGSIERFEAGKRGIIACTTCDLFNDKRRWWWQTGLASRLIPFAFDHHTSLQIKIKNLIQDERRSNKTHADDEISIPDAHIFVPIPDKFKNEIFNIAESLRKRLDDPKGYRRLKQIRSLAKAHALSRTWKKTQVTEADVAFLHRIDPFISFTEPHAL